MSLILNLWIAQDVFSSGSPGPGFTTHDTRDEAEAESDRRGTACVVRARQCGTCGSLIGLENSPIQGGCADCR